MDELYDPAWTLTGGGDNLESRRETFNRLARRAVVALGQKLSKPDEAVDAWLDRLHKFHWGRKTQYAPNHWGISDVSEASAEYCAELSTRFHEDGNVDSEEKFVDLERKFRESSDPNANVSAIRRRATRLQRGDFPCRNWLHDHSHEPLPDPKGELDYWTAHVWSGYQDQIGHWNRLDRTGPAWAALPEKLKDATAGLSYDLALLQANYAIDRGLRGDEAMQEFQAEAAKLLGQVTDVVRASWSRLGFSFGDSAKEIKMLAEAFDRVQNDLRKLLKDLPPAASFQLAVQADLGAPAILKVTGPTDEPTQGNADVAMPAEQEVREGELLAVAEQATALDPELAAEAEDMSAINELSGVDLSTFYIGGGLPSGFAAGVPDVENQLQFSGECLPDGPDELKQETANLAHAAIMAFSRGSSVPQSRSEDWLEHLRKRGSRFESMEEFLTVSQAHLKLLALNALASETFERFERFREIEKQFGELRARFFGSPDSQSGRQLSAVSKEDGRAMEAEIVSEPAIGTHPALPDQSITTPAGGSERRFRRTGDFWEVAFDGVSAPVKDVTGMGYLARLLSSPGRSFGCVELAQAVSQTNLQGAAITAEDKANLSTGFTRQPLQDPGTRAQIKSELNRINEKLADAAARFDTERVEQLRTEKDAILASVKKSSGRAGRARNFSDEEEKARKAVSAAMERAIEERIRKPHPALADHFQAFIKRGIRCSYEGDGTDWLVAFG